MIPRVRMARKRLAIARERAMSAWRRARGVWDNWPPLTVKQMTPISKRWDRRIADLTDIQRRKDP